MGKTPGLISPGVFLCLNTVLQSVGMGRDRFIVIEDEGPSFCVWDTKKLLATEWFTDSDKAVALASALNKAATLHRYEIHVEKTRHPLVDNGAVRTTYVIWDNQEKKVAPFGRFSDLNKAIQGLNRRNERDGS